MKINMDNYKVPEGSVLMLLHKGGKLNNTFTDIDDGEVIARREIKNLIVNDASKLIAMRMAPESVEEHLDASNNYIPGITTGERQSSGLKYLAVGTGQLENSSLPYDEVTNKSTWDLQCPPSEQITTTQLVGELYRKKFTDWKFLDSTGNLAPAPTNILLLSTTFLEMEAVGPLVEMGLIGGYSASDTANSGIMFNYKTFKVWNKPQDCRLSIIWKLTF